MVSRKFAGVAAAASAVVFSVAVPAASAEPVSADSGPLSFGPFAVTAKGAFPTSLYSHYFNNPTATSAQPQPVISDPVTHKTYPLELTNPDTIPKNDTKDPHLLPPQASSTKLLEAAFQQVLSIASNPVFGSDNCQRCQAALEVGKFLAMATPEQGPALAVRLCDHFNFNSNCEAQFGIDALGGVVTQVIANADVGGLDGQMLCQKFVGGLCPIAPTTQLNLTGWFAKPKPDPLPTPKKPSGKRMKVLHLSDLHIDPRYATGAEANCSGLCCRANNHNSASPDQVLFPAPRFGAYTCDSPFSLVTAALSSIPILAGTQKTGFDFTVYTGDLVSHDSESQLSRDYVMYTETVVYDLFRKLLGSGPVYAALGNHDSYNQAQDAPHSLGGKLADQFSWNYDHVAALWKHEGWIPQSAVDLARAHYAGYMVRRQDGLRVITLNTDLWYSANYFAYINMTNPDVSGMLRFLTDELQDAEDAGDSVWILGHVLTGWDGTNPLQNPTDLCDADRFSPHVIKAVFWGHTHEDQLMIYYANNATVQSAESAQLAGWIGPSVTPLTNLNSGFRVYEVDSATFEILDAHTWKSDVNSFSQLDNQTALGPTYEYEYSTRAAYGANVTGWGANDPLNGTWWHLVTESMEANSTLMSDVFNGFQGKESARTEPCTGNCVPARICYMRSGSASIAKQNCIPGFGSVQ
ncbi:sphingomyelin phosphodiesterase [Epithele typhae]|uniref:sphingomyelin phosphodiesterase n=1 Tax=Epithele typhae TaxID=378194 RepID=UPI002007F0E0|nr:sphingomyelin phosphodiesterase [Epithele typhae]KAH9944018.1 sphingomyelin phosphodiesterase [Epithele typhae]